MKIGLLCNTRDESRFTFNIAYYDFARSLGNVVLISPRDSEIQDLDLLILPGGEDVYPTRYKQHPSQLTGMPNMEFEFFDLAILPEYIRKNTPIFGICRGLQTLNVMFKGTLNQHIWAEPTSNWRHQHVHDVVDPRTNERFGVNSLHHQSISKLGDGFQIVLQGKSAAKKEKDKDAEIEAIKHDDYPILAVQFHPEELFDDIDSKEASKWVYDEINTILRA